MGPVTPLHELAAGAGLQIDWLDAYGQAQRVSDDSLRQVLGALGLPADTDRAIAESIARQHERRGGPNFLSVDLGAPVELPFVDDAVAFAELVREDGSTTRLPAERTTAGTRLPPIDRPGYHRLHLGQREIQLAVSPLSCVKVADIAADRRLWGAAVQIPALRDERPQAFGDFAAVGAAARAFAGAGADALAISPVHALFPGDASRFSPYGPSSRLFLNILFGDPGVIGQPGPAAQPGELIDWKVAVPERLALLRQAFHDRAEGVKNAVAAFRDGGGEALQRHATFDALYVHFADGGASGWQDWPSAYRDPFSDEVAEFASHHRAEVEFFIFAQWLARTSLAAAQQAAVEAGMAVGLMSDLAVGMDGGGSHAWSRRDELLTGLTIGAPPDLLGPDGQNWGLTGFSPMALRRTGFAGFVATLRAALDHAGGIRIDHVLGLRRLWVIPQGASSAEGVYLTYPFEDLLRLVAIESVRAQALAIGEDLGTVPDGLRLPLSARGIMGMRVLWFERDADGGFIPPARWPREAVAMTSTHDLPTVAGWWSERDIDLRSSLGRGADAAAEAAARARRAADRERLWHAFTASSATTENQPPREQARAVVDAAIEHVGASPSALAILPAEDLFALTEQPNVPGTIDEHPNWRRRMPDRTDRLLARPAVAARVARLNERRAR